MIKTFAKESGFNDIEILKDIGSGLKEDRKSFQKLLKMVMNRELSKVIVAFQDRLTRFETIKLFFNSYGTEIIVINKERETPKEELIEDLITINNFSFRWKAIWNEKS